MEDVSRGSDNMGRGPVLLTNIVCTKMDTYFSLIGFTMIAWITNKFQSILTLHSVHTCPWGSGPQWGCVGSWWWCLHTGTPGQVIKVNLKNLKVSLPCRHGLEFQGRRARDICLLSFSFLQQQNHSHQSSSGRISRAAICSCWGVESNDLVTGASAALVIASLPIAQGPIGRVSN